MSWLSVVIKKMFPGYKKLSLVWGQDIRKRVRERASESMIIIVDGTYYIYSEKNVKDFLAYDKTDLMSYEKEKYDCDDFAFKLFQAIRERMPYIPFGVAFVTQPNGGKHALNCFVNENQNFKMIEPQSDEIFLADKKGYSIDFVLI